MKNFFILPAFRMLFILWQKIPLMMKTTIFLLFVSLFSIHASGTYSQSAKISLDMKNMSVENVLLEIEKQSEFYFLYNSKLINVDRKVDVHVDKKNVTQVLDDLFEGENVKYNISDRQIVLSKNDGSQNAQQKAKKVSGTVVDASGLPIPGVSISIPGTSKGTFSDADGKFTLDIPDAASTIQFSYLGYMTQNVTIGEKSELVITLKEDQHQLDEVVVTALGIEKRSKGLPYTTQKIGSGELTAIKDPSMMNSLAGKMSGVTITKSSSLGAASKVVIRGNRSLQGSNQPLYVVDGIPISNTNTSVPSGTFSGSRDGSDGISNINPDDIESMNVLKGAAAAVLYGSQAANGVIVITTKKGKAGKTQIDFSSNYTADMALQMLEFQNKYGRTSANAKDSWGAKVDNMKDNHIDDFFSTGNTFINSLSLSGGNELAQVFFSYSNTAGQGIIDSNKLNKNTFNLRGIAKFFDKKLTVDGRLNYMKQDVKNRPQPSFYMNALPGLYLYPRGAWTDDFKDNYEVYWPARNIMGQNWDANLLTDDTMQNPYWVKNRITSDDARDRYIGSLSAKYEITPYLNAQGRVSMDRIVDDYERKMYATTTTVWAPAGNGRYTYYNGLENQSYADAMLNFNKQFNKLNVTAMVGTSITDYQYKRLSMDSDQNGLYYPNFFTLTDMKFGGSTRERTNEHRQLQSVFGTAQIGYNDYLFLDVTGRNDWSSTVSKSYFYPSIGLTGVISDMIKMPEMFNFTKVRLSWSQVGNDLPIYITNPADKITPSGDVKLNAKIPFTKMNPEISTSLEAGLELGMFDNALSLDATVYKTNTKNQYFEKPTSAATGYTSYYINAGNIQNVGLELTLSANPFWKNDFKWKTAVNFSTNKNKVIELTDGISEFTLSGGDECYIYAKEGEPWGDIYAKTVKRDGNGNIVVDANGVPVLTQNSKGEYLKVGNINPDFMLGWNNTFTYKAFSLGFLIDARVGGNLISYTQATLDQYGVSKVTGDARDNSNAAGGMNISAVTPVSPGSTEYIPYTGNISAKTYYATVGGRSGALGEYVYSATNVRLRELSFTYKFPSSLIGNNKFVKDLRLSLVGRNLFFFYVDAPFDPDYTMNTGNGFQSTDVFGMPTTRSIGFTLNASF